MLNEATHGLRLAFRHWFPLSVIAGMIATTSFLLAFVTGDALSQSSILRGGQQLRTHHAVVFTPYYQLQSATPISADTIALVQKQIETGTAYTSVIGNVQVENPDFAQGNPAVILVGDALRSIFPDLKLCSPAPCAMTGSKLPAGTISELEFGGKTIPVDTTLPPSATYFDVNSAGLPLDKMVVLVLPPDMLSALDEFEIDEATWRTVLLDSSPPDVDEFMSLAAKDGLLLVPRDVATDQPQRFADLMRTSGVYIMTFIAFIGLVLLAYAATTWTMLRRETRSMTIYRMYGATRSDTIWRTGAFLAVSMLAGPLSFLALAQVFGEPVAGGARIVGATLIIIFLIIWLKAVRFVSTAIDKGGRGI